MHLSIMRTWGLTISLRPFTLYNFGCRACSKLRLDKELNGSSALHAPVTHSHALWEPSMALIHRFKKKLYWVLTPDEYPSLAQHLPSRRGKLGTNSGMTTTSLTFPSLLSFLLQRPLLALCQAVTDLLSLLLCFVSWSFFPFVILCGPPLRHRRPEPDSFNSRRQSGNF